MDPLEQLLQTMRRAEIALRVRAEEDDKGRRLTFRGTTENVASDGGILIYDGADFTRFDANPVVQWEHGWSEQPVIGRVVERIEVKKDRAHDFVIEFPERGISALADEVYELARADFIVAASIGFRVTKYDRDITDEEREELGLGMWGWVGREWEMIELSLVPVGADPGALKRAVDAKAISKAAAERMAQREPGEDQAAAIRENTAVMRELIAELRGMSGDPAPAPEPAPVPEPNTPEDDSRGEEPTTEESPELLEAARSLLKALDREKKTTTTEKDRE